jgi:hypothetical protein
MSTLRVNAIQNTSGVEQYLAKAWVNFNGTGTVAIRASGNVSSITDNGVGDYTVNFTNAMADANYGVAISVSRSVSYGTFVEGNGSRPNTTTSTSVYVSNTSTNNGASVADHPNIYVAVFR